MRASTDVTWKLDGRHVCSVWAAPVKLDPDMHVILFLFRGGVDDEFSPTWRN